MYKVILVDDEKLIRQGLQVMVDWKRHGFEVIGEARNGREALLLYAELLPDLMVVDISMPVMDGLHMIKEIRKTDRDCHFIILSGHTDFSYAKISMSLGVTAYLVKPVDVNEIEKELMRIGKLMQRKSEFSVREKRERFWRMNKAICLSRFSH